LGLAVTLPGARSTTSLEVVATGVPRPLQLVMDGGVLVILSPGWRGDSAGEIYRVDLGGNEPVDLTRQPRVRIPFADARMATLGSLALDPVTGQLFLGEENGTRIYRLSADERLTLYGRGLHRLAGGSTLAFDATGRLVVLDNVDSATAPGEERVPPELEPLGDEDYRGPLVLRFALDPDIPLPRRLDRLPPLFPRAWGGKKGGGLLPRLLAVAASSTGELTFVSSAGEVLRFAADRSLAPLAHLPRGHGMYNRINMVAAPGGDVFVSGGFHVARIFLVSAQGTVATVASNLADPEGIALDREGRLYIAESSLHRIVRLTPGRM
jgi:hypothetical protein